MIIDSKRIAEAKQYCVAKLPPCQLEDGLEFIKELVNFENTWTYIPKSGFIVQKHGLSTSMIVEILDHLGTFYCNDVLITGTSNEQQIKIIKK